MQNQNETFIKILQKAQFLFAKHGYYGTTLSQLANLTALSKSSFFHYVTSKEELAVELIQFFHHKCENTIFSIMNNTALTIDERQTAFSQAIAEFFEQEPEAVFITLFHLECNTPHTEKIKEALQSHMACWRTVLLDLFSHCKEIKRWSNPALLKVQQILAINNFLPQLGFDFSEYCG